MKPRFGVLSASTILLVMTAQGCSDAETATTTAQSASSGDNATSSGSGTGGGGGSGGGASEPAWQTVLDAGDLDGAVLSVWGSDPNDVVGVGGPLGNSGYETLVVHFDGSEWRRLSPGGTETYWWVNGSNADDVWMVGEGGRITHWDGTSFMEHNGGTIATLWGVWSFAPDDAWAVGGTPGNGPGADDIVLHWDGMGWSPEALPGMPLGRALFKVWGTSSNNLYVVGEGGTIWHRQGVSWTLESDPGLTQGTLFTVTGCSSSEVYAVGGIAVLSSTGSAWTKVDVQLTNQVNGVACGPSGAALLVGAGGLKQRLVDGSWIDEFTVMPYDDLHAAWADGQGAFWAAGGDFYSSPSPGTRRNGVIARFGSGTIPGDVTP